MDTRSIFWRVCAGCLSRHHPGCWRAGNGCSACRDSLALRHPGASSREGEVRRLRIALGLALTLLVGVSIHLSLRLLRQDEVRARLEEKIEVEQERARALSSELDHLRPGDDFAR